MPTRSSPFQTPLVAAASFAVPGLGYILIGQRARGFTVGLSILSLFLLGILIAGIRVIDVPGYSDLGDPVMTLTRSDSAGNAVVFRSNQPNGQWVQSTPGALWAPLAHPFDELVNKPWYVCQILTGPVAVICSKFSIDYSKPADTTSSTSLASKSHVRVADIGTLYTAVAGLLNLLAIIDAAHRSRQQEALA